MFYSKLQIKGFEYPQLYMLANLLFELEEEEENKSFSMSIKRLKSRWHKFYLEEEEEKAKLK